MLDIQAQADDQLLEKYGLKANDAILAEEKHMGIYDDIINNYEAKFLAGGAAQNTARGAQYILPPKSVVYVGCVGKDKYARLLGEAVLKSGIRTEYLIDEEVPTGRCAVLVTGHNRSMCTDLAAANNYKIDHLKSQNIWSLVEQAGYFYVGGYHLTVCVPAILALAEHAVDKNKIFCMNLSAPFIPQFFKDQLDSTSQYWDYMIGNESEAISYSESHNLGTKDISSIARHIASLPKRNTKRQRHVIFTQGTDPTVLASSGDGGVMVKTISVHAIDEKEIVDTNGAGDAFAGGFLAALIQGKSIEDAIDCGHWLASWTVRSLGPS